MNCPYCGSQMQEGHLRCDARSGVMWIADEDTVSWFDRAVNRTGQLKAAIRGFAYARTPGAYCGACKKLIIDTDLEK